VDAEARRPEDQPACAHLRVLYTTEQIEGGRTRGWWACDSCRTKFTPVASAEYAVTQAVERCAKVAVAERGLSGDRPYHRRGHPPRAAARPTLMTGRAPLVDVVAYYSGLAPWTVVGLLAVGLLVLLGWALTRGRR
jgi:hypothetical protein